MIQRQHPVPKLSFHKASSRACVYHQGKTHYLGPWPEYPARPRPEIQEAYHALVGKILLGADPSAKAKQPDYLCLSVKELKDRFIDWARGRYKSSSQAQTLDYCLRKLVEYFGAEASTAFGPKRLRDFQQLLAKTHTRQGVNRISNCVRAMFKWGVAEELIHPDQLARLAAVPSLRLGAIEAPEARKLPAVPVETILKTLPQLSPTVAAMVRLQALTGCRPGEVCSLRMRDLHRSDPECWVYRPGHHKMAHLGRDRAIPLVGEAIRILLPFLRDDDKPLFSPADCRLDWEKAKRARRKTKIQPSQRDRSKSNPSVCPGDSYTTGSYRRAIERACDRAGVSRWSPNGIRKRAAQLVSDLLGNVDAARALLGQSSEETTRRHYAMEDLAMARKAAGILAKELGISERPGTANP